MHTAFSALPLLQGYKEKAESLLIHGGRLYLGSAQGNLSVYKLHDEPEGSSEARSELLDTRKAFSRRAIEQLGAIKETNTLVSLSDGLVWLHDLSSLSLSSQLTQTKGALTFALDTSVQRQLPLSHSPGGSIRSSKQSTVYRPSTGTLPRTRTSTSISSRVPGASGGWQAASLRGMEALVKEKEEREKRVKEGLDAEGEFSEEEGAVMTLVTVLAVGCRRKVILFRWVDGEFWDTKEVALNHSPRSFAFPQPTTLFMGYTGSDYAILTIPVASSSAHQKPQSLGSSTIPPSTSSVSIADASEWRVSELTIPNVASGSGSASGQQLGAAAGGASALGGAFSGLGGYIGMGAKANKPVVLQVEGGEVLVGRVNMGVFLGADGKPARRDGIDWPATPEDIAFARPYVFSILPAGSVPGLASNAPVLQIRSASTLVAVQTLPFPPASSASGSTAQTSAPSVRLLTASPGAKPPVYLCVMPTERGALEKDGSSVWCLEMQAWGRQIDELVEKGEYVEALSLLDSVDQVVLDDKPQRRALVQALYGVSLFSSGRYDEAIETFIELDTNPARVIALYPEKIAGPLARDRKTWLQLFGGKPEATSEIPEDTTVVADDGKRGLVSTSLEADSDAKSVRSVQTQNDSTPVAVPRERGRFGSLLGGRRPQSMIGESSSPGSSPSKPKRSTLEGGRDPEAASIRSVRSHRDLREPLPSAEDDYRRSVDALGRFLADRRRIFKPILESHPTSHDLASSSSQIKRDPDWLLALPSRPLSALELDQLAAVAQVVDTALFKTFLATKPALLGPLCRVENWCEVEQVEELLMERRKFNELIALYAGKEMHAKALQLLRKFSEDEDEPADKVEPTITYLQNLGPEHIDLILLTSRWVFETDKTRGMEIFTADTGKVEMLPRLRIVSYLEKYDDELCTAFLEHIIDTMGEGDPELHEKLIFLYLRQASKLQREGRTQDRTEILTRLLEFLDASHQYRAERILGRLPSDDMYEARALLLGRMGQHEGALHIYVHKLQDHAKAEEYCKRVFASGSGRPMDNEVFLTLLRIYLRPKLRSGASTTSEADSQLMLEPALSLIGRHGARLDAIEAFDLLPPLVSLKDVRKFAQQTLQDSTSRRIDARMIREISKARSEQVEEKLAVLQQRRVKVTETRTCPRCHKRLGNSVIAVSSTGAVLHYYCAFEREQRPIESPSTRW